MTAPCIGCGRAAPVVRLVAQGAAALHLGADVAVAEVGAEIGRRHVCADCMAKSDAEAASLRRERERLRLRGVSDEDACRIMRRRVDRYFRNGRFVPLGRAAAA